MKLSDALLEIAASIDPNVSVEDMIGVNDDESLMYIKMKYLALIIWKLYLLNSDVELPPELLKQYIQDTMPTIYNFPEGVEVCIPIY